jgi:putative hydrolase of the HAD superfamily
MADTAAVIFDLDDTLTLEREYAFSGFAAVAAAFTKQLGPPHKAAARMRILFDTEHRRRVFNQMLAERGLPAHDPLVQRMIGTYRTHRPTIALLPDAERALHRLRDRHRLGLITDGPAVMQFAKVDVLGLAGLIDTIILTAELGPGFGKPHPRAFEMIAGQLGVAAECCVYVADNAAKDFVAPNALGWKTVQVIRPDGIYADRPAVDGGMPQSLIATLDDLEAVIT